jgi:hypothetical protein
MKTKKVSKRFKYRVILEVSGVINKDTDLIALLLHETEYLAEPKTANGCITNIRITDLVDPKVQLFN